MNKAQIRMMESIFVMVIFLFLIGFGFVFYFGITKGAAADDKIEQQEQKSVEVALFISQLPELQCSEGGTEGGACIDLYKAYALNKLVTDSSSPPLQQRYILHYYDLFGFTNITLTTSYPSNKFRNMNTANGLPLLDNIVIYSSEPKDQFRKAARTIFFPVTIKDVVGGEEIYTFGQLEVKVFT